jgi:uncharacterized membrane protein
MRNVVHPSLMKMLLHFRNTLFVLSSVFLLVFEKFYEENTAADMSCFQVQLLLPL